MPCGCSSCSKPASKVPGAVDTVDPVCPKNNCMICFALGLIGGGILVSLVWGFNNTTKSKR